MAIPNINNHKNSICMHSLQNPNYHTVSQPVYIAVIFGCHDIVLSVLCSKFRRNNKIETKTDVQMQYLPFATTEKIHFFHLKQIHEKTFFEKFFSVLWLKH